MEVFLNLNGCHDVLLVRESSDILFVEEILSLQNLGVCNSNARIKIVATSKKTVVINCSSSCFNIYQIGDVREDVHQQLIDSKDIDNKRCSIDRKSYSIFIIIMRGTISMLIRLPAELYKTWI